MAVLESCKDLKDQKASAPKKRKQKTSDSKLKNQESRNQETKKKDSKNKDAMNNERNHSRKRKTEESRKPGYEYLYSDLPVGINECCFGDEYFFYEDTDGSPKYEDINDKWDEFVKWVESIWEKKKEEEGFEDSYPGRVGHEVIKWAKRSDAYPISLITQLHWEIFRDTYLLEEGCPEIVLEFIRGIMYGKMTEKQMWGPREERQMKGKLIVFNEEYLPKEGEDTGDLEIIYQPITYPPEYDEIEDKSCPIEYYPKEKVLFPKKPLMIER